MNLNKKSYLSRKASIKTDGVSQEVQKTQNLKHKKNIDVLTKHAKQSKNGNATFKTKESKKFNFIIKASEKQKNHF